MLIVVMGDVVMATALRYGPRAQTPRRGQEARSKRGEDKAGNEEAA